MVKIATSFTDICQLLDWQGNSAGETWMVQKLIPIRREMEKQAEQLPLK